jgi:broad specificity phosphatase PhoE
VFLHGHQLDGNVARPVTAEAVGTFVLVLAITSAVVAAALSRAVAGAPYDGLPVIPCLRPSESQASAADLAWLGSSVPRRSTRHRSADARIGQRDDPMGAEPQPGKIISMTVVYLVQHGDKQPGPGDPGLTELGRIQAARTGRRLGGLGIGALWASPMRRAWETAECIAAVTGLAVQADAWLQERLNWDGSMPWEAFADLWARTAEDRDLVPGGGQSAREAAARLQEFLADLRGLPGPVAAVTHGGVTAELLRTLLGDDALPLGVVAAGIPPCAITTLDDLNPVMIASVSHLP